MRGRKPKIQANGNVVFFPPPTWLSKEARAEWRRVLPILVERRILTDADLASFENYCLAVGQVRQLERILMRQGYVVETERGPRANPAAKLQSDAMTRARLLACELGLTPVSRSRPTPSEKAYDDDSAALGQ